MRKICGYCHQEKPYTEFFKNRRKKDGLQIYCKSCKKPYDQQYYRKNKEKQYARIKKHLLENKIRLWEYLKKHPCVDCQEKNPIVLEFDHRAGVEKKGAVSYLLSTAKCSWKNVQKEIEKCEIRCANCHRIRTAKQLGWYKFLVP